MSDDGTLFDTIVAPATPPGRSALAIVRLDGPDSLSILRTLAGRTGFEPRVAAHVQLRDQQGLLDDAVAIYYQRPRSFTGNDLVEVVLHGNPALVQRLIRAVEPLGARIAEPGEFSERAVLNGKLDLLQAESISDLISSRTALQARLSLTNIEGRLSAAALRTREALLQAISRLEAALDFSDEGYEFIGRQELVDLTTGAMEEVRQICSTYERGRAATRGLKAVILGQPNAGKSTLLNFLCGSERAIVTPVPGTTRDLIQETIEVGGLPVTFIDTAGLRESVDVVESIGIDRARKAAADADLVLYLVDTTRGLDDADRSSLREYPQAILVFTKVDLKRQPEGALGIALGEKAEVSQLMSRLDSDVRTRFVPPEESPTIVNERQKALFEACGKSLEAALDSMEAGASEEIVVVDLKRAAHSLALLVGAITEEDLLREIFAKFCIGK